MATESTKETSAAVALFQKAHNRMVTLQRLDEQVQQLLDQRRKLQDELREVQGLINHEFNKVIKAADEAGAKLVLQMGEAVTGSANGNGRSRLHVDEEAEANS
jgi:predicted  nucleic acid-binding Zn-ribbon protein